MWTEHKTLSTRIRIFLKTDIFSPLSKNTLPRVAYLNNLRTSIRYLVWHEQQRPGTGASSSHTLKIVPERLAEMVWFIKFRFLLLNIDFSFSGFQARTLFTFATVRIGVYTAPKCGTEPIRYVTLHFRDWLGPASIRHRSKSRRNHLSYVWTEALSGMIFAPAQK